MVSQQNSYKVHKNMNTSEHNSTHFYCDDGIFTVQCDSTRSQDRGEIIRMLSSWTSMALDFQVL